MRINLSVVALALSFLSLGSRASEELPCRVIEDARIETQAQLNRMKDVCEVRGALAIFADGVEEIIIPRLKRVGIINIESYGLKAISFPQLQFARDIYFSGSDLEVAAFPSLQEVSSRFVVRERNLKFLNLPEARRIGRLILQSCLQLEFVFADKLYDIASSHLDNNPALNPASAELLKNITRVPTPEELAFIKNAQEDIRELKRKLIEKSLKEKPLPPTGHPTHFDSFGLTGYYSWYPYEYSRFYDYIGPWHYMYFVGPPFFWFH
jgi:hypothetical protein